MRNAALIFLLFFLFAKSPKAQNEVFDFVQKVVDNQDTVTVEGVKVSAYWVGPEVLLQTVHVFRDPNRWRFDYFPFKNHTYQETILDRGTIYHLKLSKRLIFRLPFDSNDYAADRILNLAADNYDWIDEGIRTWSGFKTHQIAAVSHASEKIAVRFWIDVNHKITLADTWYDDEGAPIFASYYAEINFPKRLPDSVFTLPWGMPIRDFPSPKEFEGAQALKEMDFKPLFPVYLPPGFKEIGIGLTQWPTHRKLHFRYSDGLRDLSVYENLRHGIYHRLNGSKTIQSGANSLELLEQPNGRMVRFPDGSLTIAVEGNLSADTLTKVALSIATPVNAGDIPSLQNRSFIARLGHYFQRGLRAMLHHFSKR